jgi:serine/threonine protein kinase
VIGHRLGHYEILATLGEGGMGVVYKARDTHLDRFAAIKVLPSVDRGPSAQTALGAGGQSCGGAQPPGIVTIYDISHADGTDFIAMEFVEGRTLAGLIGRRGLGLKGHAELRDSGVQLMDIRNFR